MNIVFLGPPGSGKGTMAERVAKRCGLVHISTGDMLREHVKQDTGLGRKAKTYMESGGLVPDELILDMIKERFSMDDARGGVLLDGFPRNRKQAEELDAIMKIDKVIDLVVDEDVIVDRAVARRVCGECGTVHSSKTHNSNACGACGAGLITRPDDNEKTVRERYRVYEEKTAPLIDYYGVKGLVRNVDATLPIDEEADFICKILGEK